MKTVSSIGVASEEALLLQRAQAAVDKDPQALFTDFQWFLFEAKDAVYFTAFSTISFTKDMVANIVAEMVALAPQMTHGGIFAVIVDVAAFAAIYASSGNLGPTIDMRVDFHANAPAGELLAVARTLKSGKHILTGEVSINDERNHLLASGRGVYFNKSDHLDL